MNNYKDFGLNLKHISSDRIVFYLVPCYHKEWNDYGALIYSSRFKVVSFWNGFQMKRYYNYVLL